MYPLYLTYLGCILGVSFRPTKTSSYSLSLGFLSLKYNKSNFKCQKCLGFCAKIQADFCFSLAWEIS
mgnify:CR=1 FL=1